MRRVGGVCVVDFVQLRRAARGPFCPARSREVVVVVHGAGRVPARAWASCAAHPAVVVQRIPFQRRREEDARVSPLAAAAQVCSSAFGGRQQQTSRRALSHHPHHHHHQDWSSSSRRSPVFELRRDASSSPPSRAATTRDEDSQDEKKTPSSSPPPNTAKNTPPTKKKKKTKKKKEKNETASWTASLSDTKTFAAAEGGPPGALFAALRLSSFTDDELKRRFEAADADGDGALTRCELYDAMRDATVGKACASEVDARSSHATTQLLQPGEASITYGEFKSRVVALASRRDPRIWPIAATMALGGLSVGAIMPVMPCLVHDLDLTATEYGLVVSSFGAAKLLANAPAAIFVDAKGRRSSIVIGLSAIAAGFFAVGLADGFFGLAAARALTGAGVAFLVTGSTLAATDLSTPLNRASTTAPLGAAFNAGTVAGPALGGALAGALGPSRTFFVVAAMIGADALYARLYIKETAGRFKRFGLEESANDTNDNTNNNNNSEEDEEKTTPNNNGAIADLLSRSPALFRLCAANASYWFTVAGVNMTVLPLTLSDPTGLNLDPSLIGSLFAAQAVVGVAGAMPVAALADKVGPERLIAPAFLVSACANGLFPLAHTYEHVAGVMVAAALGASLLGSAPTAAVANAVPADQRARALALLRTAGDVGMLAGSAALGTVGAVYGHDAAFELASTWLFGSAAFFFLSSRSSLSAPRSKAGGGVHHSPTHRAPLA